MIYYYLKSSPNHTGINIKNRVNIHMDNTHKKFKHTYECIRMKL